MSHLVGLGMIANLLAVPTRLSTLAAALIPTIPLKRPAKRGQLTPRRLAQLLGQGIPPMKQSFLA